MKNLHQSRSLLIPLLPNSFNLCNSCFLQDSWKPLLVPAPPTLAGVQQKLDMCFAESNLIKLFRGFTRLHLAICSYLLLHWFSLHWKSGIFSSPLLTFPQEAFLTCANSMCLVVLITKNIRSIPLNCWGIYVQLTNPAWSQVDFVRHHLPSQNTKTFWDLCA